MGRPINHVSVVRDLTERKASEAGLRESERRFREMLESVRLCSVMLDGDGRILFINAFLLDLIGGSAQEVLGKNWFELYVPSDQRTGVMEVFESLLKGALPSYYENEILTQDGGRRLIAWNNTILRDSAGRIIGATSIGEDITLRRKLERELAVREQRLNSFFSESPAGLSIVDSDLRYLQINETLARVAGASAQDHLGKTVREMLPALAPTVEALCRQVLKTGEPILNMEVSGIAHGGHSQIRHWVCSYFPISGEEGRPIAVGTVAVEITEQKRAEAALRDSEEKFRQLAENIDTVFWIRDAKTEKLLYVSPAFERIWGRSCQRLLESPQTYAESIHPDDRERILARRDRAFSGDAVEDDYRIVRPDGSVRWIHDRAFAVRNAIGEAYRLAGFAEDITERRQLEEQLRQAQKMEAVGQLAGGVAHDFNNIIAAILMHLGLLQYSPQLLRETKETLKEVETAALRAANLTRQLLVFSRRQVAKIEPLNLNAVIKDLLKMLRRLLGENIEVDFEPSNEDVWVRADAGMLEQVVMNLCVNARDAMAHGGRLTVTVGLAEIDARTVQRNSNARLGRFACLKVMDTGCGIDEKIIGRIFEPFFTTKESGRGTGLGLATVYGIVRQHEGWIDVESQVGRGSTFRAYFPALDKKGQTVNSLALAADIYGGSETILLVEDELAVRRASALCLRKLGYSVLEATTGPEALEIWGQYREKIKLLIADMIMPQAMTGLDLARRLKRDKATLTVVISSGYTADAASPEVFAREQITYLPKPYQIAKLAQVVGQCLNGQAQTDRT